MINVPSTSLKSPAWYVVAQTSPLHMIDEIHILSRETKVSPVECQIQSDDKEKGEEVRNSAYLLSDMHLLR